jgi:phosphoribosylformylglycinamidine synthase PurS subunit
MRFMVSVDVMPKKGISDPQGLTIERALPARGFEGITEVRVGKHIEFIVEAADERAASAVVVEACERLLSNPVIEDFRWSVKALEGAR